MGPVAVSIKRERIYEPDRNGFGGPSSGNKSDAGWIYQYRIIVRTSEVIVMTAPEVDIVRQCAVINVNGTSGFGIM